VRPHSFRRKALGLLLGCALVDFYGACFLRIRAYLLGHPVGDGMVLGFLYLLPKDSATGDLAGKPLITTVDSNLAKYALENPLDGTRKDPGLDHQIAGIDERYRAAPLDRQTLKAISHNASPDFAALFLIKQLLSNPRNLKFQTNYLAETKRIKSDLEGNEWSEISRPALRRYEVLFAPGFHYLTDRSSGQQSIKHHHPGLIPDRSRM